MKRPSSKLLPALAALTALSVFPPSKAAAQERVTQGQRNELSDLIKSGAITGSELEDFLRQNRAPDSQAAKNRLSPEASQKLLATLEARFNGPKLYEARNGKLTQEKVTFASIKRALEKNPALMWSLARMEETGGAPNLVKVTETEFVFADVSAESPKGRRNLNYDQAKAMADEMRVQMMSPEMYRKLQGKVNLDSKTWSWLLTDVQTRQSGRALGGARDDVDVYVLESYADTSHPTRGWRASLRVSR